MNVEIFLQHVSGMILIAAAGVCLAESLERKFKLVSNTERKESEMPLPSTKFTTPTPQQVFAKARQIAVDLGKTQQFVNADQVYSELDKLNYPTSLLGSAAGSIFSKKLFRKADFTVQSNRQTNRGRRISNWSYIGV